MLVAAFLASAVGFVVWLGYVSYKDPAGIFRPPPRGGDAPGDAPGDAGNSDNDKADPGA